MPLVYVTRHVSLVYVTRNVLVWLLAGLALPRTSQTLVYMLFHCNGHTLGFFVLPVFLHSQLYVALSISIARSNIRILTVLIVEKNMKGVETVK